MTNRGGLLGAALIGTGGVCTSLKTLLCEPFEMPWALPLLTGCTGTFSDEAELL